MINLTADISRKSKSCDVKLRIYVSVRVGVCVFALQGYEFAEHYRLEYQREENGPWFRYRNRRDEEVDFVVNFIQ